MSADMHDWESNNKFRILVLGGIYTCSVNQQGQPQMLCGFLEDEDHIIRLPHQYALHTQHISHTAVSLFKQYIGVDLKTLDIVPYTFFDPIYPKMNEFEMATRDIFVSYKTLIQPGTPVNSNLRFLSYEQVEVARTRIARGHYQAYRAGVSG